MFLPYSLFLWRVSHSLDFVDCIYVLSFDVSPVFTFLINWSLTWVFLRENVCVVPKDVIGLYVKLFPVRLAFSSALQLAFSWTVWNKWASLTSLMVSVLSFVCVGVILLSIFFTISHAICFFSHYLISLLTLFFHVVPISVGWSLLSLFFMCFTLQISLLF